MSCSCCPSVSVPGFYSWAAVIEKASKSVVSLRVSIPRSFEGELPACTLATGFVVDKTLGLILTNRHVVCSGPSSAQAIFGSHEESIIYPIFRDPIHDFGLFRFNPADIAHMKIEELELYPQGVKLGVEIRVVGNDAGEKAQVLSGTISRVDRESPEYGGSYQDQNTFYISAASSTSGGSSGSPVLDIRGRCVALNAGAATQAASSFFLPLDRVVRAVEHIRKGVSTPLPRNTLHCIFAREALDEVKRLGLTREDEDLVRQTHSKMYGMLVVSRVVPGGVAHNMGVAEGDILLRVNDKSVIDFTSLEHVFDTSATLDIVLRRGAETLVKRNVVPESLWDTLPDEYLEYSGGILHELSYMTSSLTNVPFREKKVFVSFPGYSLANAGLVQGSIITKIGHVEIRTLDDFEQTISKYADGAKVGIRFFHVSYPNLDGVQVLVVDHKWFAIKRAKRDDKLGTWVYSERVRSPRSAPVVDAAALISSSATPPVKSYTLQDGNSSNSNISEIEQLAMYGMVWVTFRTPFQIDGLYHSSYVGVGIVLDLQRGLIMVDRNTVVSLLGDVRVSITSTVELQAKVIFLHPLQNFTIIQVDADALQAANARELRLFASIRSPHVNDVRRGDQFTFCGLSNQQHLKIQPNLRVTAVERANISTPSTPRFAAKNFDVILLDSPPSGVVGGVFFSKQTDDSYAVSSVWSSYAVENSDGAITEVFHASLTHVMADSLELVISALDRGLSVPHIYSLGVEFGRLELAEARSGHSLSDEWVEKLSHWADKDPFGAAHGSREVLSVATIMAGTLPHKTLRNGDLVLAVDGEPMVSYVSCERACHKAGLEKRPVPVTVLREGNVVDLAVEPVALSPLGTTRIVSFSGLQLQDTHDAVLFTGYLPESLKGGRGVFISRVAYGSPAHSIRISPGKWVVSINEEPIENLDDFVRVAKKTKDRDFLRMRLVDLMATFTVVTMRLDLHFFATSSLTYNHKEQDWTLDE